MRSIGHIAWEDPQKWMEAMRGGRWKARVAKENREFLEEVRAAAGPTEVTATANRFKTNSDESDIILTYDVKVGNTHIQVINQGSTLEWRWHGSKIVYELIGDLDVMDDTVIYTKDVKAGGHHYQISAVSKENTLWRFDGKGDHGLSAEVAILGGRVYCLEAASPLQYKWLVSVDAKTGKDRRVHYEEHDTSASLALIRGENKCLFLHADNAGQQALYHIGSKGGVKRLDADGTVFFPVGYGPRGSDPCYFVRKTRSSPWEARGAAAKALALPTEFYRNGIDLVNLREGVVVHREHGHRRVEKGGRRVMSFWGEIEQNSWAFWNGAEADFRLMVPGQTAVKGVCRGASLVFEVAATVYGGVLRHGRARSADGSSVGWLGVWSCAKKPLGLMVVGYGAYGLTTLTDTTRWRPYIEQGWAVGFAFIRGGGDHNDVWAQEGRLAGKERGAEDFEACVRALQGASGVGANKTCLFGRSAGGYLMGLSILRNPGGELARYVYTEAPYVDVLQTSSNVALPLTVFEYLEFGDPAHSIADFEMLLRLSPVGATRGAPGVFVLCRAGLNDRQVYAYESVKWMDCLRLGTPSGLKKILYLTKGVGHNAYGDLVAKERAEDFLVLGNQILGSK